MPKTCLAIGDSITFIDANLGESNGRLSEGYLTRAKKKLEMPVKIINAGINGAKMIDFTSYIPPAADLYTVFLGTNDWWSAAYPLGEARDYLKNEEGTTLSNLGILLRRIRHTSPNAPIFLLNPIERGHFVYQFDINNTAYDSTHKTKYGYLRDYAGMILSLAHYDPLIVPVDTHDLSGFRPDNAVKYMLLNGQKVGFGIIQQLPLTQRFDAYPYPVGSEDYTYDGLHPSEKGSEALAEVLSSAINKYYRR